MAVTVSKLLEEHIWIRPHECISLVRAVWDVLPRDEGLTELLGSLARPADLLERLAIDPSGLLTLRTGDASDRRPPSIQSHRWAPPPTDVVKLLGRTLERLLPVPDAPPSYRVPDRLRALVQRAVQPLPKTDAPDADQQEELKPFRSVEEFLGVLRPFEAGDGRAALADLHSRWQACHALSQATADGERDVFNRVRRVRETVGMSLSEIAARSKISLGLLEEFERGELRHWPKGLFGRQYVREYAREAGLDPAGLLRLIESKLTPDETIDFIRNTWKTAEQAGRSVTFHDPSTEGGRYYPEPTLDRAPPHESTAVAAAPPGPSTNQLGLGLSRHPVVATAVPDEADVDDEVEKPRRSRFGRIATIMFLIFVAAAFVTMLVLQ